MYDIYNYYMDYMNYENKLNKLVNDYFKVICHYLLSQYKLSDSYMRCLSLGIQNIDIELRDFDMLDDLGIECIKATNTICFILFEISFKEELLSFNEKDWYSRLSDLRYSCTKYLKSIGVQLDSINVKTSVIISLPFLEKNYIKPVNYKLFSMLGLWEESKNLERDYSQNIVSFTNVPKYCFVSTQSYRTFIKHKYLELSGFKECTVCFKVDSFVGLTLLKYIEFYINTLFYIRPQNMRMGSEYLDDFVSNFDLYDKAKKKKLDIRLDIVFDSDKIIIDFDLEKVNTDLNRYNVWISVEDTYISENS